MSSIVSPRLIDIGQSFRLRCSEDGLHQCFWQPRSQPCPLVDWLKHILRKVQAPQRRARQVPGRIPLYSEITRENSIVAMEGTTVFKQINRFEEYQRRQKTSLAAIRKAYEAADRAASAANLAGKPQYLVSYVSLPHVGRKKEYQGKTQPCGYLTSVSTEQELHALAVTGKRKQIDQ
ncbi:hypothetical protein WJX77_001328 [Trebouxia sp. C0004]